MISEEEYKLIQLVKVLGNIKFTELARAVGKTDGVSMVEVLDIIERYTEE